MCALWSNENANLENLNLEAVDLGENDEHLEQGEIKVKRIHSIFSEKFYDNRKDEKDTKDGIAVELNGLESKKSKKQISVDKIFNKNIIGYMVNDSSNFDNARLHCNFLISGRYNGHGFFVRDDNFLEKLPLFAAGKYTDHDNDWKIMSMLMRSGDKAELYHKDIKSGKLDKFLCQTLIWTCLTHYAHLRSLKGSDGRTYLNQLCFDGETLAKKTLDKFIKKGYKLNATEKALLARYEQILERVRENKDKIYKNFNKAYKYGIYQIDEEINVKEQKGLKPDGTPNMVYIDGDLNNMLKSFKEEVKNYYKANLVDTLFEYEFLK